MRKKSVMQHRSKPKIQQEFRLRQKRQHDSVALQGLQPRDKAAMLVLTRAVRTRNM